MLSINALSLSPAVNQWLVDSRHPCILHVFAHACNLINEHREVLSIVTPQIGNGPFNLVIEDCFLFSDQLILESPISIPCAQLTLGDLTIHTADAKLWSPRPNWETLHARRDDILSHVMSLRTLGFPIRSNPLANFEIVPPQTILRSVQESPLLATLVPHANSGVTVPFTNYQSLISNLSCALAKADISSALTPTTQLAGLGIGLTPSGDDFIMGAIYAAWIIHPPEVARVVAEEITNTAAPLTTSLSAAWLKSAGRGETGILWHGLFDALISGELVRVQEAMDKILAVGATSGADAVTGFIGTLVCRTAK